MTPIRILISMMMLVVGINVSAQQISSDPLQIGEGRFPLTVKAEFNLWSMDPVAPILDEFVSYTAQSEGDLASFIHTALSAFALGGNLVGQGWIQVDIRALNGYYLNEAVQFEKVSELDVKLKYGALDFSFPGATDYEIVTNDGRIFSTLGFGKNDFGTGCGIAASQSALEKGIVRIGSGITSSDSPIRYLRILQGDLYEVRDGNGYRTELSSPAPSWVTPPAQPERRPLVVNIRLEGRLPVLVVSGDGAELAVIEQSRSGIRNWGPAITLSSPPRLSSINGGGYVYEFARDPDLSGDVAIFYRARVLTEPQNN